jgi:hypothetical protein
MLYHHNVVGLSDSQVSKHKIITLFFPIVTQDVDEIYEILSNFMMNHTLS